MEIQNNKKGKLKCRELRRQGGVPRAYAKWAVYLIPGYKAFWDAEWEKILLAEQDRLQIKQTYEQFEQDLRERVEWLERDYTTESKNIIPHKKTKSKQKERKDENGNKET